MNVQYSYRNFTFCPHWISAAKYRWLMSWKIVMIRKVKRCCSSCSNWLVAAQSVCVAVPGSLITPLNLPLLCSFRYASPYLWNQLPSFRQPHSVHSPPMEFILSPRRGGPPQTNLPPGEGPSTSPSGRVDDQLTRPVVHCMLTFCYITKQMAFILLTVGHSAVLELT